MPQNQLQCLYCRQPVRPDDIFASFRQRRSLFWADEPFISPVDCYGQTMLTAPELSAYSPEAIIAENDLNLLLKYLHQHYGTLKPNIIFSALVLVKLHLLENIDLHGLDPTDQRVALWWLLGYSPANPLLFSAAQTYLEEYVFSSSHTFLFQLADTENVIAVVRQNNFYHILTPFNQYFLAASVGEALEILSVIASANYLSLYAFLTTTDTIVLSSLGALFGISTGLPFAA